MFRRITLSALLALAGASTLTPTHAGETKPDAPRVAHRTVKIDGLDIFYR